MKKFNEFTANVSLAKTSKNAKKSLSSSSKNGNNLQNYGDPLNSKTWKLI